MREINDESTHMMETVHYLRLFFAYYKVQGCRNIYETRWKWNYWRRQYSAGPLVWSIIIPSAFT